MKGQREGRRGREANAKGEGEQGRGTGRRRGTKEEGDKGEE